jgi:hypothetical protein
VARERDELCPIQAARLRVVHRGQTACVENVEIDVQPPGPIRTCTLGAGGADARGILRDRHGTQNQNFISDGRNIVFREFA